MGKEKICGIETGNGFSFGEWQVWCPRKRLTIINRGISLATQIKNKKNRIKILVTSEEGLEKVIFDTDKKTVSVKLSNPRDDSILNSKRTADLNGDEDFFEYLHQNLDKWMMKKGDFSLVTPNEDRTVFEVK